MDVEITSLPNGLRVATSSLPHVESATLGIWIAAGSRHEHDALAGVSHFIEHMLFKGTRRRSARDISQSIEGKGGYMNAFTQEDATCYYARVPCDQLMNALNLLREMYQESLFAAKAIETERAVIIDEIAMYRDHPDSLASEMLSEAIWKQHELGRPVLGRSETVGKLTRRNLLDYMERRYVAAATTLAVAGRVNHRECVEWARRAMGSLRRGGRPRYRPVTGRVEQEHARVLRKDTERTHFALGIRLFGRRDPRRYALRILNAILGENMSSRLFQSLRERTGLAYSIQSGVHLFDETGALIVNADLDTDRLDQAIRLILADLARLKKTEVRASEFVRARDYVIGQLRLGLESTVNRMMWLGDNLSSYGRIISPEEIIESLASVTAADVRELARALIQPRRISMAAVSPALSADDAPALERMLDAVA